MATKPNKLPEWASADVTDATLGTLNKLEPSETKKDNGWLYQEKPPYSWFNWWMNLVYKWLDFLNDTTVGYDIVVYDQTTFDATFTGTIAANTSIFIKKGNYNLNNVVTISDRVIIHSDGAVVTRNTATAKFQTTYKGTGTVSGTEAIGQTVITLNSGHTIEVGDLIKSDNAEDISVTPYRVIATTATSITLDKAITVAFTGAEIYSFSEFIDLKGWFFDGQGGVNGLGGSYTSIDFGGFATLDYCANSNFEIHVYNCAVTTSGGAYYSSLLLGILRAFNNKISNISNCSADSGGGGGGGCYQCYYSTISNISNCSADSGGGCYQCDYSTISNISNCSADSGGGGGCYLCYYSTISNISNCSADSGGGCYQCAYSTISNISNCSADSGGGCYQCDYSTISNISNCTASSNGGGCGNCDYCFYHGYFEGNTAVTAGNEINNGTNSFALLMYTGSNQYAEVATAQTVTV